MLGLWAVAKLSFRQCLRTKVAGLSIALDVAAQIALPFLMRGDGTLAGQIRTFLSYSISITALLLSVMTVFLTASAIAGDVQTKQIFSVATKPIARWQYVLGRWLGVVMLDAVLLAISGGAIYGFSQYLRTGQTLNANDRRAVETEVFTARARVAPAPLDIDKAIQEKIDRLKNEGQFESVMDAYRAYSPGDDTLVLSRLVDDLRREMSASIQSIAPGKSKMWRFSGIKVAGGQEEGVGRVAFVDKKAGVIVIEADPRLVAHLIHTGPVRIDGEDGRVVGLESTRFGAQFPQEAMIKGIVARTGAGQQVAILIDPIVQVSYKVTPASSTSNPLASNWEVQNPTSGFTHIEPRNDPPQQFSSLVVSTRAVDPQGRVDVRYYNFTGAVDGGRSATSVTILNDDMAVRYRVGSFEWNLVRATLLVMIQLMFLAALGVLAGSFLSFPVACLFTLFVLMVQSAMGFLLEAANPKPGTTSQPGLFDYMSYYIVKAFEWLLPNGGGVSPADALVDGMIIPWSAVGMSALQTSCLLTAAMLGLACFIFHKRELARVQV